MSIPIRVSKGTVEQVSEDKIYKYVWSTSYAKENIDNIMTHLSLLKHIKPVMMREEYFQAAHDDKTKHSFTQNNGTKLRSREKLTCKYVKFQHPKQQFIGDVVDFQIPLKTPGNLANEGLGEVDLVSIVGDTAWLLELKDMDSTEHPLKSIIEIFTYWKQLGGNINDGADFLSKHKKLYGNKILKKGVLLYEQNISGVQTRLFSKLMGDTANLRALMTALDVSCFIIRPCGALDFDVIATW